MPPQTRRMTSFPRVLIERDTDGEDSSSSSDDDEEEAEEEPEHEHVVEIKECVVEELESDSKKKSKASITIALKKVCKVCKRSGHEAGFRGATYIDCPMKPCFLCKTPGHTTVDCPHRVVLDQGAVPAPRRNNRSPLDYIFERQIQNKIPTVYDYLLKVTERVSPFPSYTFINAMKQPSSYQILGSWH